MNRTLMEEGELGKVDIQKDIMDFYIQHDMPIDCLWTIVVRPNWRIYLQFAEFNLEKPNDCHSNFVQVFSGKTDMASIEKEFCGSIADTVMSKSNKMYVRFFSESKGPKTLFLANFTAYRDLGSDGKTKECNKSNEFYCEDATCIHKSLVCNSRYNCRFRWDEEDEGCQGAQTMAWSGDHIIIIMIIFSLILAGMCITFLYNCVTKLIRDHQTIQEYRSRSLEQQLNELDKQQELAVVEGKASSKLSRRTRSHDSSHSMDSNRFDSINAINSTSCYAGEGDVLSILVRNERSSSPSSVDAFNTNLYTVDGDNPPQMCDSACQTRESLFTTQGYNSSDNSTPNHSAHTNSPPAPFSTFGYKKEIKFKAEAKIEVAPVNTKQQQHSHMHQHKKDDKHRPYSVQTTKSAPDVIVTH
nr:unnamed protein product [Callosobruchus chinensis]